MSRTFYHILACRDGKFKQNAQQYLAAVFGALQRRYYDLMGLS